MGSSEARRGTKTVLRKTEAMFRNFSRINWPEGELLNNSLNGLYECNHRTKTNKEKGRHLCAILPPPTPYYCTKKTFTQVCHMFAIYFEMNIVCVFRAELTIEPPFLTKNLSVSSTNKNTLGFSSQAHAVARNERSKSTKRT